MPELPEVETLRLQLAKLITGNTIKNIDILKVKSFIGDKKLLENAKIVGIRRFAKMLAIDFSNGLSLVIHLKMSGQLIYKPNRFHTSPVLTLPTKHTRVIINFTNGDKLFFNDIRMFGWVRIVRNETMKQFNNGTKKIPLLGNLINKLGPDPIKDLTVDKFKEILKISKRPIKVVLMDQEKLAGVGNIYANDALFLAKIHPKTLAFKLGDNKIVRLFNSLLLVLKAGVKWGGASKANFLDAYGNKGHVQEHFYVYDREGDLCPNRCGTRIQKIKLGGRGTFFCPACQR